MWIVLNKQQLVFRLHSLLPGSDGNTWIHALSIYWGLKLLTTIYGIFFSTTLGEKTAEVVSG